MVILSTIHMQKTVRCRQSRLPGFPAHTLRRAPNEDKNGRVWSATHLHSSPRGVAVQETLQTACSTCIVRTARASLSLVPSRPAPPGECSAYGPLRFAAGRLGCSQLLRHAHHCIEPRCIRTPSPPATRYILHGAAVAGQPRQQSWDCRANNSSQMRKA